MRFSIGYRQPRAGTLPWRHVHGLVVCLIELSYLQFTCRGTSINYSGMRSQLGHRQADSWFWFVSFDFWQCFCALSCMNCICCVVTVCSITLARASTLTCSLLRQLLVAWRVLLSWALISLSRGTLCSIRLHTSSRFCWVSWSFSAYVRSEKRSRVSFLPVGFGACDCFGIALLALPFDSGAFGIVNWEETATGPWLDVLWHHPTLHCTQRGRR